MSEEQVRNKLKVLNRVFTPAAPIQDREIFAGRLSQLRECFNLSQQPGMHGIIYGDRGVGKTSIANILRLVLEDEDYDAFAESCDSSDTLLSVWRKVLRDVTVPNDERVQKVGFAREDEVKSNKKFSIGLLLPERKFDFSTLISVLRLIRRPTAFVIDEFDRLNEVFDRKTFSDVVKYVSDHLPHITLYIVGVADNVNELIGDHASVERNVQQIPIPVMTTDELEKIVRKGLSELSLVATKDTVRKIVTFSSGYPHYVHLLSFNAAYQVVVREKKSIKEEHFNEAVRKSLSGAHESLRNSYQRATLATKRNIFREVLWAASDCPIDENGTFQARDLEGPLSSIMGQEMGLQQYIYHLGKFCTHERGEILVPIGEPNRRRYKFKNPLMKPFIRLNKYTSWLP